MTAPESDDLGELVEEALDHPETADLEGVTRNTTRKLLTLLVGGAALLFLIHATPLGEQVRNWDSLTALFRAGGLRAELYFVLISSVLMMAGVPRLLFCGVAGLAFGFWEGMLWSLIGSLLGSYTAFRIARWGGREWLTSRFGSRRFFRRIVEAKPTVASVFLIRLLPVSNAVVNVGLALGRVGDGAFVVGSLLGFLPQGVVAVLVGSGMGADVPMAAMAQISAAFAVVAGVFYWLSRKRRSRA